MKLKTNQLFCIMNSVTKDTLEMVIIYPSHRLTMLHCMLSADHLQATNVASDI